MRFRVNSHQNFFAGIFFSTLGSIVATLGLVTVSGVAYKGFRWSELAILSLTLSAFVVGVFAYGLRFPFQALPV